MVSTLSISRKGRSLSIWILTAVFLASGGAWCQQDSSEWQQRVREKVQLHELGSALVVVDQQLQLDASDLEAHGWRGRLLAWQGQWSLAEDEYRLVLGRVPNDFEILCALADVLVWQNKLAQALAAIDQARAFAPADPEVLVRRARILEVQQKTSQARDQYRELLHSHPENKLARQAVAALRAESKHELRLGYDGATFNYTDPAESGAVFLTSHWTRRFTTGFSTNIQQRFGQNAFSLTSSGSFWTTDHGSVTLGGTLANHQAIIAEHGTFFEYSRGLHFSNPWAKGLELSYNQHWYWYEGGHVLTVSFTQLYYLPRDWTWSFSVTGARSGLSGSGSEWVPSGYTRLGFPIYRQLGGSVTFANGTENFAQMDQIGHFSAHTYAGGLKYRLAPGHDMAGYIGVQNRTDGRIQRTFGMSYGYRF